MHSGPTCYNLYAKLEEATMRQSMSRVGHCIGNEPMEGLAATAVWRIRI
jgi:hypothetical protein